LYKQSGEKGQTKANRKRAKEHAREFLIKSSENTHTHKHICIHTQREVKDMHIREYIYFGFGHWFVYIGSAMELDSLRGTYADAREALRQIQLCLHFIEF